MLNAYNRSQIGIMERAVRRQEQKEKRRKFLLKMLARFGGVLLIGGLVYTSLSADCSTGGSCDFTNGAWFNWIATHVSNVDVASNR